MIPHELYLQPIAMVDRRARLYRQCEAMLDVMENRGIDPGPAILERIGLLDMQIEKYEQMPIRDLMALHGALAAAIKPALPEGAELLHWEQVRPKHMFWDRLNFLAPVSAIRKVMLFTLLCFVLFFVTVIFGPLSSEHVAGGIPLFNKAATLSTTVTGDFWADHGKLISLTVFYTSLSAIGACFATLYAANRYVTEGSYDPRYGASYAIRIGLGMMSGFLLSQILPSSHDSLTLFGRTVLALLGGFAGNLVYDILQKLVSAAESVFEEDPRDMITRMQKESEQREQVAIARQQTAQAAETFAFVNHLQNTTDPSLKMELARNFITQTTGVTTNPAPPVTGQTDPAAVALERAVSAATFLRRALEILPPDEGKPVRDGLERLEKDIARVRGIVDRGDLLNEATKLAAQAAAGPLTDVLAGSLGKFKVPLAALGISPPGLAIAIVTLAAQSGSTAYRRWKARVLNAPYVPDLLPVDPIDAAAVKDAFTKFPEAEKALAPQLDNMSALNTLGRAAADLDVDSFFQQFGQGFAGARAEFDAMVAPLRDALRQLRVQELDRLVAEDIPNQALALSTARDRPAFLEAIGRLQDSGPTLAELEKLFLLAATIRGTPTAAGDLKWLTEILAAASPKGATP